MGRMVPALCDAELAMICPPIFAADKTVTSLLAFAMGV
jgi:hypothetical protein